MKQKPVADHKYRKIFDSTLARIQSGELAAGSRLPTEDELGKEFSASRITVNRAMRELQLIGVIERRPGAGSFVAATVSRQSFGLLIPGLGQTEIFEPICQGIVDAHRHDRDHDLIWAKIPSATQLHAQDLLHACRAMLDKSISGVFFAPVELVQGGDDVNRRVAQFFTDAGIPVILLDRDLVAYPQRSAYDLVGIDNRRAGYQLAKHLIDLGRRRLAFVAQPNSAHTVSARIAGYREALLDRGLPVEPALIFRAIPDQEQGVADFLKQQKPDGILCANDFTAATLMKTLSKLGVRIPEDVSVVGIDDVKYAALLPKPLTTIRQPCLEIGETALYAMLERIRHPDLPARDISLSFELIVRESCGATQAAVTRA